jgi:hypothetical protein
MPGPAPKPEGQRRRRNAVAASLRLPAEGRSGPPPKWPLLGRAPRLWAELWTTPQAAAWERLRLERLVAKYVQDSLDVAALRSVMNRTGEPVKQYASLKTRVDRLEAELGLTPMGLLKNRWEIVTDEVSQKREESTATPAAPAPPATPRRRLSVAGGRGA